MSDASEILSVIFEQERTIYKCDDYLAPGYHASRRGQDTNDSSQESSTESGSSASSHVDENWRGLICEWSFQVVDHFDFSRETVAIALSYLDRFVASRPLNRRTFQLAAMTALYLAIKLFEPGHLKVSDLVKLSQGSFVPEHIVMMEESILRALEWHVHPPTALGTVHQLTPMMLRLGYDRRAVHDVVEYSRFLTELSVCDYFFVTIKPSSIGLAAVLVAIEQLDEQRHPNINSLKLLEELRDIYPQETDRIRQIKECKGRLLGLYLSGGYDQHRRDLDRVRSPDSIINTADVENTVQSESHHLNQHNNLDSDSSDHKPTKSQRTC